MLGRISLTSQIHLSVAKVGLASNAVYSVHVWEVISSNSISMFGT